MKSGRVVKRDDGGMDARCPYCKKDMPLGVWAIAHLSERILGTCRSCGRKFALRDAS